MSHIAKKQLELGASVLGLALCIYGAVFESSPYAALGAVGFVLLIMTVKSAIKHMRLAGIR